MSLYKRSVLCTHILYIKFSLNFRLIAIHQPGWKAKFDPKIVQSAACTAGVCGKQNSVQNSSNRLRVQLVCVHTT